MRSRGSPIYGELMPTATQHLLTLLDLRPDDHFVDLGAGLGKVVLMAAMTTPARAVVGVELSTSRLGVAEQALARARAQALPGVERARFVEADMMTVDLDEATVVYTCSTAFSDAFMEGLRDRLATLPRLRKLATLQDFDPHPALELTEVHKLDASWKRKTKVYIYEPAGRSVITKP